MIRPESSPDYLAHCAESLMNALAEARLLALDADSGSELAETLKFASDLLAILDDGVPGLTNDPHVAGSIKHLRTEINSLRCQLITDSANLTSNSTDARGAR